VVDDAMLEAARLREQARAQGEADAEDIRNRAQSEAAELRRQARADVQRLVEEARNAN
jgi:F0F1-type ATP synthase membrane subunit b/b'